MSRETMRNPDQRLFFSTYTNLNWLKILESDLHKAIIIESLEFLVVNHRVKVYSFVIMPNHIHLIWLINEGLILHDVQRDFLKYTAQNIKYMMIKEQNPLLDKLLVNASDRKVQIWERNGLSFPLNKKETTFQKLHYIHNNPLKKSWGLSLKPEDYRFSSARFYETEVDEFKILSHINELFW